MTQVETAVGAPSELAREAAKKGSFFEKAVPAWFLRNRWYFLAFLAPAILTYIAYAIFGLTPFGKYSVLCLDLNGQYVYYYEALRDAVRGDGSIFYNWSENLSGSFIGTIGYYTASPFMWIIILLPEKYILTSVLLMQLAKVGMCGLTFSYYLQKSKKLNGFESLPFAMMYAMMAYVMIQLIDPMWIDGVYLLPLIILGIEYLVDKGSMLMFTIPLALMFVFHFYIGFMVGIFSALYFLYYFFLGTPLRDRSAKVMGTTIVKTGLSAFTAVLSSSIMILSIRYALSLGKFDFTDPDYSFKFQFDLIGFFRQLLVNQYDSVNVWGSPEIYCGILGVVLVPLFFMNKKVALRRKIGIGVLLLAIFLCMAIKPVDMMWHGGQSPNWLPYRYSFVVSFVLLSVAAESFKKIEGVSVLKLCSVAVGYGAIYSLVWFVISKYGIKIDSTGILRSDTSSTSYLATTDPAAGQFFLGDKVSFSYTGIPFAASILLSMSFAACYLLSIYIRDNGAIKFSTKKANKVFKAVMLCVMTAITAFELTFNAVKEFKAIDKEVAYSTTKSWNNYIANGREVTKQLYDYDDSFYRCEKTYFRCINDNMAFGLRGLSYSTSVMNANCLRFLEGLGYAARTYYCRYDGNTPVSDSLLGIKYVFDRDNASILNKDYTPVFTYDYKDENDIDKTVTCYKNEDALSIGYMADQQVTNIGSLGNDNPFNSQNILLSSMVGETDFDTPDGSIGDRTEYYKEFELDSEPILNNVTQSAYGDQICYNDAKNGGDPTVDFNFTVTENSPIYIYFRTDNEKSVNLWYGPWNDGTQAYDYQFLNTYFETEHYCIMPLGSYEPGTKMSLRMTIANDYTIYRNYHFVYFQQDLFDAAMEKLKKNQWQIDTEKSNARMLTGTITAEPGQVMVTSIPYEGGWSIKVDGKKISEDDTVRIASALIGIKLEPGEHTVTMKYTPPYWWWGILFLLLGIVLCIFFYRNDKKSKEAALAYYEKHKFLTPAETEEIKAQEEAEKKAKKTSKESSAIAREVLKERGVKPKTYSNKKKKK